MTTPLFRLDAGARRERALEHRGAEVAVDVRPLRLAALTPLDHTVTGRLVAVAHAPTLGAGADFVVVRVRNGAGELVDVAYSLAQVADIRPAEPR